MAPHFEERLRIGGDLGNLHGDRYTFGGREFDISETSVRFLRDVYSKVAEAVLKKC